MIVMYDSIDVDQIPLDAPAVAGYVGGHWPTYPEILARFPHAYHLSIAVTAAQRARCLDVEAGDARNDQAAAWLDSYADKSQGKPVLYTSASNVSALRAAVGNRDYYMWSAHYTQREHICGGCGYPPADATQWTSRALGRNLDQSLCQDYFFTGAPVLPLPPIPPEVKDMPYSITAQQNDAGDLHVFLVADDGRSFYTWQKHGTTGWHGGQAGKQIAGWTPFAPAPPKK